MVTHRVLTYRVLPYSVHIEWSHIEWSHIEWSHIECSHRVVTHRVLTYRVLPYSVHIEWSHIEWSHIECSHRVVTHTLHFVFIFTLFGVSCRDNFLQWFLWPWSLPFGISVSMHRFCLTTVELAWTDLFFSAKPTVWHLVRTFVIAEASLQDWLMT